MSQRGGERQEVHSDRKHDGGAEVSDALGLTYDELERQGESPSGVFLTGTGASNVVCAVAGVSSARRLAPTQSSMKSGYQT